MPTPATTPPRGSLKPRPRWDRILALAETVEGTLVEQHRAVLAAFERGELDGPVPKYHAFWRRMTAHREQQHTPPRPAELAAPDLAPFPAIAEVLPAPDASSLPAPAPPPGDEARQRDPRLDALWAIRGAETSLLQAAARLSALDLLSTKDIVVLRRLLKRGNANRLSAMSVDRLLALARSFEHQTQQYRDRLRAAGYAEESTPATPAEQPVSTTDVMHAGSESAVTPKVSRHAAALPGPEYQAVVGHVRLTRAEKNARLRARILTPVLNGSLSAAECAAVVRALAAGAPPDERTADLFGQLPAQAYAPYRFLSARTLQRWAARVRQAEALARAAGEAPPPVSEVLLHRQPEHRSATRTVTPEVLQLIIDTFKDHPNLCKADVALMLREAHGIQLSERHVQRLLATRLSEVERAAARGGVAGDMLFRARLFRDARRPNETWIGDHSFLRQEHLDPERPEDASSVEDFDWECEVAVEHRTRLGDVTRERRTMHLTLWIDAFSRRVLAVRVWDSVPTTRMTLASLFDAVRQFGLPQQIYTDNGSDFRSQAMQEAIAAVGIHHAFSRPYTPEGRGIIERMFRTIKQKVMPHIPGYHGGRHRREWHVNDLLTPEQLEARIWRFINTHINRVPHRATRRCPAEYYDAHVGVRDLAGVLGEEAAVTPFLELLPMERRVLHPFGVAFGGMPYWCGGMNLLPDRSDVYLHYEPLRWEHVYISVPDARGALRFLGRASVYDLDRPPPDFAETLAIEAAWREFVQFTETEDHAARSQRALTDGAQDAGTQLAVAVGEGIEAELERLTAPPKPRLLPAAPPPSLPPAPQISRRTARPRRPATDTVIDPLV